MDIQRSRRSTMEPKAKRSALLFGVAAGGMLFAAEATAQQDSAGQLDEVVVTAQRSETNLQKTPLSVTAIPAAVLQQRGATTLLDLSTFTPNLSIVSRSGTSTNAASFSIRGMGVNAQASQGAVGVYLDEVYFPSANGNLLGLLDVERVEVLRGPQGTLFGRNTIAGAVQYITVKPGRSPGGYAQGTVGSHKRRDLEGAINLPLGDMLAVRLTLASNRIGGFVTDDFNGVKRGAVDTDLGRVQLRWTPTDRVTVDLKAELAHQRTNGRAVAILAVNPNAQFAGLARLGGVGPLTQAYVSTRKYHFAGYNAADSFKSDERVYQGTLRYRLTDAIDFKSISAYANNTNSALNDVDLTPLPILRTSRGSVADKVFSQEFQLTGRSLSERLRWTAGFYYYDGSSKSVGVFSAVGNAPPAGLSDQTATKTRATAGYGQATFNLTDQISAVGGLRYSHETFEGKNLTRNTTNSASFNNTSPHFGLNYQATDDMLFYVKASRGFRAGGFTISSNLPGGALAFGPETAWTYEAGARLEFLQRRLRINPTVFLTDWKNIQFNLLVPTATTIALATRNAGDARIKGAELEAQFAATDRLLLTLSASTLEGHYTRIPVLTRSKFLSGFPGPATIEPNLGLSDPLQQLPEFKYAVGARYTHPFAHGGRLIGSFDWGWTDEQASAVTRSDSIIMPSYGLLNARLQYQAPGGRWSVSIYGTNIGNQYYLIGAWGGGQGYTVGADEGDPGRPAEYGLTVRVGF